MCSTDKTKYFEELLSFVAGDKAEEEARRILSAFVSTSDIASSSSDVLRNLSGCSEQSAEFISLISAISSRRITDEFKPGRKYSPSEIEKYVCALLFHLSVESVYMISFSQSGKLISTDLLTEGTVNSSAFLPRKMADIALRRKAARVILAHNHPSGNPLPSENDVSVTLLAESVLRDAHVKLEAHYITVGFTIHDCLLDVKAMLERKENVLSVNPVAKKQS